MPPESARGPHGFTLVELVIVIMIIGMLAAMAIPRMSRGAETADEAALAGNLHTVRTALLRYYVEHRNNFPGPDADKVAAQLLGFTDMAGATSATSGGGFIYGPYLVSIPAAPLGYNPGSSEIAIDASNSPPTPQPSSSAGWLYNPNTGEFQVNASDDELKQISAQLTTATTATIKGE